MPKTIIIIAISLLFSTSFANWEAIGPYGGYLYTLTIAPSQDNLLYVTTNSNPCQILKSTDYGNSWSRAGLIPDYVYSFAIDPTNPNILYVGSYRKIYKSTNGGSSWTGYLVSDSYIWDLAVHPDSPTTVFAAGIVQSGSYYYMGFFKSTNGGMNWTSVTLNAVNRGYSYCLAVDPSNPDNIYVGGYIYSSSYIPKIYKSTNGGSNFSDASSGVTLGNYVFDLAVHPSNSNIVYTCTFYGYIYRTTNGGSSWSQVHTGSILSSLATTPVAPNIVYAGADTLVYKSTNSGATWFETGSGHGGVYKSYRRVAASRTSASVVYTTDMNGCFKTTNGGTNWFDSNYGINISSINCLSISKSSPSIIYTDVDNAGVYKTTNGGSDWTLLPSFLSCGNICGIGIDITNPDRVFALEGLG